MGNQTDSDRYRYWEIKEYSVLQLLPPGDFVAVFFDEETYKLYTEPLLFLCLADEITRYLRAPHGRISEYTEHQKPLTHRTLSGVQFETYSPLQVVGSYSNCVGIMPSTGDMVALAEDCLLPEQLEKIRSADNETSKDSQTGPD